MTQREKLNLILAMLDSIQETMNTCATKSDLADAERSICGRMDEFLKSHICIYDYN